MTKKEADNKVDNKLVKFLNVLEKKKIQDQQIVVASNCVETKRIRSGIFPLDFALGGGVPIGHKVLFYGKNSSGKTTVVLKYISEFIKQGYNVLWVDTEGVLGITNNAITNTSFVEWAKINGVDVNKLYAYAPSNIEIAVDVIIEGMKSVFDVIVIDSLAMFEPIAEKEASAVKEFQALQARAIGKMWRKIISEQVDCAQKGRLVTMLMTNQIRYKLGVMYGNPETKPGGVATDFVCSIEVELSKKGFDDSTKKDSLQIPRWVDVSFRITKNKTFSAGVYGEFRLVQKEFGKYNVGDVVDSEIVLMFMLENGYAVLGDDGSLDVLGSMKFASRSEFFDFVYNNKDLYLKMKNDILDIHFGRRDYGNKKESKKD